MRPDVRHKAGDRTRLSAGGESAPQTAVPALLQRNRSAAATGQNAAGGAASRSRTGAHAGHIHCRAVQRCAELCSAERSTRLTIRPTYRTDKKYRQSVGCRYSVIGQGFSVNCLPKRLAKTRDRCQRLWFWKQLLQ